MLEYGSSGRFPTDLLATMSLIVNMGADSNIIEASGAVLEQAETHGATGPTILRAVVDSAGAVLAKVFVASVCGLTKAAVAAELADDVKAETCVGTSMMVK